MITFHSIPYEPGWDMFAHCGKIYSKQKFDNLTKMTFFSWDNKILHANSVCLDGWWAGFRSLRTNSFKKSKQNKSILAKQNKQNLIWKINNGGSWKSPHNTVK